jgi:hypothetical protein
VKYFGGEDMANERSNIVEGRFQTNRIRKEMI